MTNLNFRKIHRQIAPILFIPLFLTALTGVIYRLGKSWFGMPSNVASIFLRIHQGSYLGNELKPIYVLLVGLGLIGFLMTGIIMFKHRKNKAPKTANKKLDIRTLHRFLAPILFLPLFISAITGIMFRLGMSWFNMPSSVGEVLMSLHQGEFLGDFLKPIYVFSVGLGLILLIITGIDMTGIFRKRRVKVQQN